MHLHFLRACSKGPTCPHRRWPCPHRSQEEPVEEHRDDVASDEMTPVSESTLAMRSHCKAPYTACLANQDKKECML